MAEKRTIPRTVAEAPKATPVYLVRHVGLSRAERRRHGGRLWRLLPVENQSYRRPVDVDG
ncbi:MAG: hypothetical protein ACRD0W_00155 [Acidimicrobiales bacterium]